MKFQTIVVATDFSESSLVEDARREGAVEIVSKPLDVDGLLHLIAEAVRVVGTNRGRIREYLAGVGTDRPAHEGVTGAIAFDDAGDVADRSVWIGVVRSGQLLMAPGQ